MLPFSPLLSWLPETSSNGNPAPMAAVTMSHHACSWPVGAVGEVAEGEREVAAAGRASRPAPSGRPMPLPKSPAAVKCTTAGSPAPCAAVPPPPTRPSSIPTHDQLGECPRPHDRPPLTGAGQGAAEPADRRCVADGNPAQGPRRDDALRGGAVTCPPGVRGRSVEPWSSAGRAGAGRRSCSGCSSSPDGRSGRRLQRASGGPAALPARERAELAAAIAHARWAPAHDEVDGVDAGARAAVLHRTRRAAGRARGAGARDLPRRATRRGRRCSPRRCRRPASAAATSTPRRARSRPSGADGRMRA